jgi:hypothetical protein
MKVNVLKIFSVIIFIILLILSVCLSIHRSAYKEVNVFTKNTVLKLEKDRDNLQNQIKGLKEESDNLTKAIDTQKQHLADLEANIYNKVTELSAEDKEYIRTHDGFVACGHTYYWADTYDEAEKLIADIMKKAGVGTYTISSRVLISNLDILEKGISDELRETMMRYHKNYVVRTAYEIGEDKKSFNLVVRIFYVDPKTKKEYSNYIRITNI